MNIISELLEIIGLGLMMLLPLCNPLTTIVLMLTLSGNKSQQELNKQAAQTALYVFLIMIGAYYLGQLVMHTFGISIPGLRIAGGLIVAFLGFRMLFPQPAAEQQTSPNQQNKSIAFIPLAMPGTAGPGTIAMIISSAATVKSSLSLSPLTLMLAPAIIFTIVSLILWICLRSASNIIRLLGYGGIDAIARFMGFLLICMGVQFIINGILEIVNSVS